jgi:hypothetical protein
MKRCLVSVGKQQHVIMDLCYHGHPVGAVTESLIGVLIEPVDLYECSENATSAMWTLSAPWCLCRVHVTLCALVLV